uniref:ADAM metallopeptidase with thrombospondin type 1 motif, 15b n=1 Tax=Sphaeramia orbicularis TaxID=375764 RepID=A0A673C020_9TELE
MRKMCSTMILIFLSTCVMSVAFSAPFESEDVVPVRINGRISSRFWKRSEEQPRYILSAFGQDLTLSLIPDTSFIAPYFTIQRIKARDVGSLRSTKESEGQLRSCFYSGNVDHDQNSVVAVSLCSGIYGSFITEGKEYLIEPKVRGGLGPDSAEQLHVIKRRTLTQSTGVPLLFDLAVEESRAEKHNGESFTHGDSDAHREPRRRRFVSAPRFIETLVVADSTMTHFYGDEIKHYILTLMSMAAQLYKHPSIKNSVNMVVVKMLVQWRCGLEDFCTWQQLFNPPSQRHPEHYDTAMLFTREDICGQKSCDTLGVADVGTMCDPREAVLLLRTMACRRPFTAAHELGQVLSMPHDDSKTCERLYGDLGGHYLMAPLFVSLNKTSPWSPCSALYITEFFDNGHGDCLLDVPENAMPLPEELPGIKYNLDQQCQQIFGEEYVHCPNTSDSDICSQLWCQQDGTTQCTTKNGSLPWADGTNCGVNGMCLHGVCMPAQEVIQPPMVVDGGWSSWGPWQQCSRTCGGGVEFSYRECTDPVPQNGGKYCEGQRVQYQSCNTQPCDDNSGKSFREEQCEKYNSPKYLDYNGNVKQWIPKYAGVSPRDRCKLFCRARGSSEFKVFESKVIDGTTCGPDTTSVCVQGQCVKAGCDQVIGSNKRVDKCGVCGGSGLTCRKITGSYNKAIFGYSDIVTIPVGATNIDIKQRSHKGIKHDGTTLRPLLSNSWPLEGMLTPQSGLSAQECGSGWSRRSVECRDNAGFQSSHCDKDLKPTDIRPCGDLPCPIWQMGPWSACSRTCGQGSTAAVSSA